MKAAICDDNKNLLYDLNEKLKRVDSRKIQTTLFASGDEIAGIYKTGKAQFDVVFLDIEMEGMDGIETANIIREIDKHVLIVFVTNHTKYMQRSFECLPFRFLVKPIKTEMLEKTYREICIKLADRPGTFVFTENKQHIRIFCEDILFFESRGHWIVLHKRDGSTHKIRKNMKELMENVDESCFCRVHRAFVVNLHFVYLIGNTELALHGYDGPLPIGRTYKKALVQCFKKFAERRYFL